MELDGQRQTDGAAGTTDPLVLSLAGASELRTPCHPAPASDWHDLKYRSLADQMREFMRKNRGVGLAANQVGMDLRMLVIEDPAKPSPVLARTALIERDRRPVEFYALLNPSITRVSSSQAAWFEGCLSVPGLSAVVVRASEVEVRGYDVIRERERTIQAKGWHARILQHELDHLDGFLYMDRMISTTITTKENYARHWQALGAADLRRQFPEIGCLHERNA